MTLEFVERARNGDREAYERIAREIAARLFDTASRIIRDRDEAEDAVQQTLVEIWRDLRSLRDASRFDAWSYRILVRHCQARSKNRRQLSARVADLSESIADRSDAVAAVAERDELSGALRRLTTEQRTVLVLHYFVGMQLGEIAEVVGVPYGTVGSRMHNAKRALRAALEEHGAWAARENLA
jgi:RNA polymerase sigma-70 factor (ECF subfamily)